MLFAELHNCSMLTVLVKCDSHKNLECPLLNNLKRQKHRCGSSQVMTEIFVLKRAGSEERLCP